MGAATTFFTAKRTLFQQQVAAAQEAANTANANIQAATTALNILAKSSLTPADGENLIALYEQLA